MDTPPISRRDLIRIGACVISGSFLVACNRLLTSPQDEDTLPTVEEVQLPGKTLTPLPITTDEEGRMPELKIEVLASGLDFPEGPAFAPDGSLWCTELLGGNLVRLSGLSMERIPTNGRPNGLAFDWKGRAWVCDSGQNAVRRLDPESGIWETLVDQIEGATLQAPNDLCFDSVGNLLFTCPNFANTEPIGYVCCLTPGGILSRVADGYYRPNGIGIVEGGEILVVADTFQKVLFKGRWDAHTQAWTDVKKWADVGGAEGPDGMAPGMDGLLYQAIYGDGVIRVVDPGGAIAQELSMPGLNPTNAAIDPSGKLGLVVTETEHGQLLSIPEIQPGHAIFDGEGFWE